MKVRYKAGKFNQAVSVAPGDLFNCTLTEEALEGGRRIAKQQKVSERITKSFTISHWVMFWIPGCPTVGGMFGTEETLGNINNIFVDAVEVPPGESLMN